MPDRSQGADGAEFKAALDKQNKLETNGNPSAKQERDKAEGEAAQSGLRHLEKQSTGRPKRT